MNLISNLGNWKSNMISHTLDQQHMKFENIHWPVKEVGDPYMLGESLSERNLPLSSDSLDRRCCISSSFILIHCWKTILHVSHMLLYIWWAKHWKFFVLRYFLISNLITSLTSWLYRSILFSLYVFMFFTFFSCNWYLIP